MFVSIDILAYSYMVEGKEDMNNENDNEDNNVDVRENETNKDDEKNDVPFILPFTPIPFP